MGIETHVRSLASCSLRWQVARTDIRHKHAMLRPRHVDDHHLHDKLRSPLDLLARTPHVGETLCLAPDRVHLDSRRRRSLKTYRHPGRT
jgi:hypothetical protein